MRKVQQNRSAAPKIRTRAKPRFVVIRKYSGSQSMKSAFEQAIETQACGRFESWREKRERGKNAG